MWVSHIFIYFAISFNTHTFHITNIILYYLETYQIELILLMFIQQEKFCATMSSVTVNSSNVEKWKRIGIIGIEEIKLCNIPKHSVLVWLARAIKGLGEP